MSARIATVLALVVATHAKYEEHFYEQTLDHFHPESSTSTWQHRYLLNNTFFDGRGELENGCPGPILL